MYKKIGEETQFCIAAISGDSREMKGVMRLGGTHRDPIVEWGDRVFIIIISTYFCDII